MLSALYGEIARRRREWYERRPDARRRLAKPVVSVGNLAVGGSGKTPAVAHLAKLLVDAGERPAILSRGYARAIKADGVVVVRDRDRVLADLARAGDEPLMLARRLDGVVVLVATDRHLAGVLAERQLGATVHLLDDGFQHMMLERDVDLVLVDARDLDDPRTLPAGRLREPVETIARADAVVFSGDAEAARGRLASLGARRVFHLTRRLEAPRACGGAGAPAAIAPGARVLAVAGIARPQRFAADLKAAGWIVAGECVFPDHHPYSRADVARVVKQAGADRADAILTTEKDLVRLLPVMPEGAPIAWVPLGVSIEPAGAFRAWLLDRVQGRRSA
jgi:tetraacyldisaccharide 4'-kinase